MSNHNNRQTNIPRVMVIYQYPLKNYNLMEETKCINLLKISIRSVGNIIQSVAHDDKIVIPQQLHNYLTTFTLYNNNKRPPKKVKLETAANLQDGKKR